MSKRFEDIGEKNTKFTPYQKRHFMNILINGKLGGKSLLNIKRTILKKINFSLFIFILVNTASVSMVFEHIL